MNCFEEKERPADGSLESILHPWYYENTLKNKEEEKISEESNIENVTTKFE